MAGSEDVGRPSGPPIATVVELFAGRYQIHERNAWNGLSLIYRATLDGRQVAVAVLPLDCEGSEEATSTFTLASRDLIELTHPGIVATTGYGIQHGVPFFELEYAEGPTLAQELARGPLDRDLALSIMSDVLETLEAAHSRGAFHWDLTPSNILLGHDATGRQRARLIGVGVAPILRAARDSDKTGPTGKGSGPGAAKYIAPERMIGDPTDGRADLYSVGVLLEQLIPNAPELAPIIARAMERSPADRYSDAGQMLATLKLATTSAHAPIPAPLGGLPDGPLGPAAGDLQTGQERSKLPLVIGAAVLGGIGLALGVIAVIGDDPPDEDTETLASSAEPDPTAVEPAGSALAQAADSSVHHDSRLDAGDSAASAPSQPTDGNDWLAGPLPAPLGVLRTQLQSGETLDRNTMNPVYDYAREHRDDPRPHLLLAHAFVGMRWNSDAIERYLLAWGIDPEARHHSAMLEDLLDLVHGPETGMMAAAAIRRVYGAEAISAIDEALSGELRPDVEQRLRRLRGQLEQAQ